MDEQELDGVVARLLQEEQYAIAEKTLRRVHAEALEANRVDPAVRALGHLTRLYTMQESLGDAEDCHAEIEKLEGTAWSLVSFSWFYLYGKQDFQEARRKVGRGHRKSASTRRHERALCGAIGTRPVANQTGPVGGGRGGAGRNAGDGFAA